METCFNYTDKEKAFFSSDELRWVNKIRKLKEQYPDEVQILAEPASNDGCIYCRLPVSWLKVQPKVKRELTEEERQAYRERMLNIRSRLSDSQKLSQEK